MPRWLLIAFTFPFACMDPAPLDPENMTATTGKDDCDPGQIGCVCVGAGMVCLEGLVCESGLCRIPKDSSASASGTASASSDNSTSDNSMTDGETSSDATGGSGSSTGAEDSSTTGDESSTTTGDESSTTTGDESSTTTGDGDVCDQKCDLFDAEACGTDQMCTSWFCEPETVTWDNSICAPIGLRQKGEACVYGWVGPQEETCAKGLTCFGHECIDTCVGSIDEPSCPSSEDLCVSQNDAALAICLKACDPLASACPETHPLCTPGPGVDAFVCAHKEEGSDDNGHGSICKYVNSCQAGHVCIDPGFVDALNCDVYPCCTNICDTTLGDEQCAGSQEECLAWFDPPISGYENVGSCRIF